MRTSHIPSSSMHSFESALKGPFFETNPLPMWIFDRESFQFLVVNEAAVRRYGYSKAEFKKMKVSDIRPNEDVQRFVDAASEVKDSIFQAKGTWKHRLKNGDVIYVVVHATKVRLNGRNATLSIMHEMTDQIKAELDLKETLERQEAIFEGSR